MRPNTLCPVLAFVLAGLLAASCGGGEGPSATATPLASPRGTAAAPSPEISPAGGGGTPTVAPTPVAPTATPPVVAVPSPTVATAMGCAAGVTAQLQEIDAKVPWDVYCATYLPPGYELELVGGPDPLEIRIASAATGSRIYFVQSITVGLSAATSLVRYEGELVGEASYGELPADLFRSLPGAEHGPFTALIARPPEGEGVEALHIIEGFGVSEEEMRAIGASMRKVAGIP